MRAPRSSRFFGNAKVLLVKDLAPLNLALDLFHVDVRNAHQFDPDLALTFASRTVHRNEDICGRLMR